MNRNIRWTWIAGLIAVSVVLWVAIIAAVMAVL